MRLPVSNRQHLALNVCSRVHTFTCTHRQCVPGGEEDGQKDVQNKHFFFFFALPPKTLLRGALTLDRDVQVELSMTTFTPFL